MAVIAAALAEEDALARELLLGRLCGFKTAKRIELRRRRKIDHVLHLRHHRDLIGTVRQVHTLPRRADVIAVEVSSTLLELSKVLDRTQRAF